MKVPHISGSVLSFNRSIDKIRGIGGLYRIEEELKGLPRRWEDVKRLLRLFLAKAMRTS